VDGRKLVGSAQRRARGGVLQHGSIRLGLEPASIRGAAGLVTGRSTSLAELGFRGAAHDLITACVAAFGEALEAEFEPLPLAGSEIRRAQSRGDEPAAAVPAIREIPHGGPQEHLPPTDN
jgi:lipoate-protein ligase A